MEKEKCVHNRDPQNGNEKIEHFFSPPFTRKEENFLEILLARRGDVGQNENAPEPVCDLLGACLRVGFWGFLKHQRPARFSLALFTKLGLHVD
jgi:hypothetical protein